MKKMALRFCIKRDLVEVMGGKSFMKSVSVAVIVGIRRWKKGVC